MARRVRAKTIVCSAPTLHQVRRLWEAVVGDGAVIIEADEIMLQVWPAVKPENRKPKTKGRHQTRKTP